MIAKDSPSQTKKMVETSDKYRTWRDNSGKFEIEASLVTKDSSKVVLKKRDGSVFTVPLSKLSLFDIKYLNELDQK